MCGSPAEAGQASYHKIQNYIMMKILSNFEMIKTSLKFKILKILMLFYPEPKE